MLDHTTMSLFLMIVLISLGRVFGRIRFLESGVLCLVSCIREDPHHGQLRKRHIIVVDWCCMCKKSGESVDHLLLHCEIASALWNAIFNSVGLAWVMPSRVVDLFACWRGQVGRLHFDAVWKMIPSCLMWCLWRERNDQNFEDRERTLVELNAMILIFLAFFFFKTLYHWAAVFDFNISSFQAFLDIFSSFN
jgi:hypothetical protein